MPANEQSDTVAVPKLVFKVLAIFMPVLTGIATLGVTVLWGVKSDLALLTVKADRALEMQDEINKLRVQLRDLERSWDREFGNETR